VKLVIQIPCLDEETTLPVTLADLPRSLPGVDEVMILVLAAMGLARFLPTPVATAPAGDAPGAPHSPGRG
jgi:hypothetical protein